MKKFKVIIVLLTVVLSLLVTSCRDDDKKVDFGEAPSLTLSTGTVEVITEDQVRYHVLSIADGGLIVTMVESETGLTIVDLGLSSVALLGDEIRAYADMIGKPMSIAITHAHQDHYGNFDKFTDIDFYAESTIADLLMANEDFSAVISTVNKVTYSQRIQGFEFKFKKISAAEASENGYIYMKKTKALFASDLIYNQAHNFIREYTPLDDEDELTNWINGLNTLKSRFGYYKYVFVGHGGNGVRTDISTAIDENIAYLTDAQGIIKGTKPLTAGGTANTVQEVIDELKVLYPDYADGALTLSLPGAFGDGDPGAIWFE